MVAIKTQQIDSFLKAPDPRYATILVHGADAGLVAERARLIANAIAARDTPPGEVLRLDSQDLDGEPERLSVELQTLPMFGGRKVIRTSTGPRITINVLRPLVEIDSPAGALVVEAGALRAGDALRNLFEKAANAAAIACYGDEERDLSALVSDMLGKAGLTIRSEARDLLVARLGADRALSRNEIEKLILYVQGRSSVEAEDIEAVVGDAAELAGDRVVMATFAGNTRAALAEIERALAAGENLQSVLLAMQRHVHRLHRLRASVEAGASVDETLRGIRPPVHFKVRPLLEAQMRNWQLAKLDTAERLIATAIRETRLKSEIETPLAERLLLVLAQLARPARPVRPSSRG